MSEAAARVLSVLHVTRYAYSAEVEAAQHAAVLVPRDTPWQRVLEWELDITPEPDGWRGAAERVRRDAWGNARLVFGHARVHNRLTVSSRFSVALQSRPAPDPARGPAWEQAALQPMAGFEEVREFGLPSPLALPDAAIRAFAGRAFEPGATVAQVGLTLQHLIHDSLHYRPASTQVSTRAAQALAQGAGVCQDFAHLFIACARSRGLAARYVSGYLLTQPPPGQPRLVGADASHAWVELWCPEQGWMALDPTNDIPANLDHVTLAWGRDYNDVAPLRGVLRGGGTASLVVEVTVEPEA